MDEENCRKLWAAVLENAVLSAKTARVKRGNEAINWIHDKRNTDFNSFIGVCRILDLDPDRTRQNIIKYIYG